MPLPGEKPQMNAVAPQPQAPSPNPGAHPAPAHDGGTASLSFYLEAISQGKWLVLGFTAGRHARAGLGPRPADPGLRSRRPPADRVPEGRGSWHGHPQPRWPSDVWLQAAIPGRHRDRGDAVEAAPRRRGGRAAPRRLRGASVLPPVRAAHRPLPGREAAGLPRLRRHEVRLGGRADQGDAVRRPAGARELEHQPHAGGGGPRVLHAPGRGREGRWPVGRWGSPSPGTFRHQKARAP